MKLYIKEKYWMKIKAIYLLPGSYYPVTEFLKSTSGSSKLNRVGTDCGEL